MNYHTCPKRFLKGILLPEQRGFEHVVSLFLKTIPPIRTFAIEEVVVFGFLCRPKTVYLANFGGLFSQIGSI